METEKGSTCSKYVENSLWKKLWTSRKAANIMNIYIHICVCVCVCVYIYIYIYIYTHTHTHKRCDEKHQISVLHSACSPILHTNHTRARFHLHYDNSGGKPPLMPLYQHILKLNSDLLNFSRISVI